MRRRDEADAARDAVLADSEWTRHLHGIRDVCLHLLQSESARFNSAVRLIRASVGGGGGSGLLATDEGCLATTFETISEQAVAAADTADGGGLADAEFWSAAAAAKAAARRITEQLEAVGDAVAAAAARREGEVLERRLDSVVRRGCDVIVQVG